MSLSIIEEHRLLILKYEAIGQLIHDLAKLASDNAYNGIGYVKSETLLRKLELFKVRLKQIEETGR